ncbi:MAG: cellulose biosynthesis protein BcsS [Xanthobacteraceae bacterium]
MGRGALRIVAVVAAVLAASPLLSPAHAGDIRVRADYVEAAPLKDRLFFFAGANVARDSYFGWAGVVGAPQGLLDQDGPRIRISGGGGRYRYDTSATAGGTNSGQIVSGEILLGFRRSIGSASVTAYLGAHAEDQRLDAPDPGNPTAGTEFGVKAALEFFVRPAPTWTWSASAVASTVHRSYHAHASLAREFMPGVAFGIEGAVHGDARYVEPRAGILAHMTFGRSVVTLSGGVLSNSDDGSGAYATLSLYAPY